MRRPMLRRSHQDRRRVTLLGRGLQVLLATATAVGATLANPGVAWAHAPVGEMTCKYDNQTYNVCLLIEPHDSESWDIHVGIDVSMNRQAAQRIAAQQYSFFAFVVADDPSFDNTLFSLTPTMISAGDDGIGAEWDTRSYNGAVLAQALNEDSDWLPGCEDEIYILIKLYDAQTGTYRTWTTNVVQHTFGGFSCLGG